MPDYAVKVIGHIDERKRPEGFPHAVFAIGTYRAESAKHLADQVNSEVMQILQMQGMIISVDSARTIDTSKVNAEGRVFVPMHMITYLQTEIQAMAPMPQIVETGVLDAQGKPVTAFEMPDGKKVQPS